MDNGRAGDNGASCDVDGLMAVLIATHGYFSEETWEHGQIKSELKQFYNRVYSRNMSTNVKGYVNVYKNSIFKTNEQKERYDKLMKDGIYSEMKTLGSPFVGKDWISIVSSKYGWRIHPIYHDKRQHNALDIPFGMGTPVNSVMDGKVSGINSLSSGYGNHILIEQTTEVEGKSVTYSTLYAHLSEINVRQGQRVIMGQVIGKVGSTGASTGAHLHLELWKNT